MSAAEPGLVERFASEPAVESLQREAVRLAELDPARAHSWMARAGKSALLPTLRGRVGRGMGELARDGTDRILITNSDNWSYELTATWSLDRLIFDRDELYAGREAQLMARRRQELMTRVAQLYFARRRLQLADHLAEKTTSASAPDATAAIERTLQVAELTAILDGLTGGALTRKRGVQ